MPAGATDDGYHTSYITFSREAWAALRDSTPLTLTEADLASLRGLNEELSLEEVAAIYLPLSRLLNLRITATQQLAQVTATFLGTNGPREPFIIGLAGSVAAGKSTTARILQALLSRWPDHRRVELVTTDGFLYPNAVLEERGLMKRKGFPESYDLHRLLHFVADVKAGKPRVEAPVYSHLTYDIIPDHMQAIEQPDVMILEGLNVLQRGRDYSRLFVSDFFDFSIYVDADLANLRHWYVQRFLRLRETAFRDPASYFRRYGDLTVEEARIVAQGIWQEINERNLVENIAPTRERADLVLAKASNHTVREVWLRQG